MSDSARMPEMRRCHAAAAGVAGSRLGLYGLGAALPGGAASGTNAAVFAGCAAGLLGAGCATSAGGIATALSAGALAIPAVGLGASEGPSGSGDLNAGVSTEDAAGDGSSLGAAGEGEDGDDFSMSVAG